MGTIEKLDKIYQFYISLQLIHTFLCTKKVYNNRISISTRPARRPTYALPQYPKKTTASVATKFMPGHIYSPAHVFVWLNRKLTFLAHFLFRLRPPPHSSYCNMISCKLSEPHCTYTNSMADLYHI